MHANSHTSRGLYSMFWTLTIEINEYAPNGNS